MSLGSVVAGDVDRPRSGRTVFCSVGLAGTEAYLLARLLDHAGDGVRLDADGKIRAGRPGRRPTTSDQGPHRQLDQQSAPQLWGELIARVFRLDGVVEGASQVSPPSSRAVFLADLPDERAPGTSLAPGRRLEPVHLHGVHDTSVHLVLPAERGRELVDLGWAEPHQHADHETEFMIYGPRDAAEVEVILAIIQESLAFARAGE